MNVRETSVVVWMISSSSMSKSNSLSVPTPGAYSLLDKLNGSTTLDSFDRKRLLNVVSDALTSTVADSSVARPTP